MSYRKDSCSSNLLRCQLQLKSAKQRFIFVTFNHGKEVEEVWIKPSDWKVNIHIFSSQVKRQMCPLKEEKPSLKQKQPQDTIKANF